LSIYQAKFIFEMFFFSRGWHWFGDCQWWKHFLSSTLSSNLLLRSPWRLHYQNQL
jgi:hypothetical protein